MGKIMHDIELITKIQRQLKDLYQNIGDSMLSGTVDNMEKYKYMMGQAHAYVSDIKDELPQPSGWRLLVLPFTPKEKTKGGIIIAQESLDKARIATNCGYVVKMGPMAYGDKEKFPTGAWCKQGDWVIFARYAGSRLPIEGGEVRLLNDDEVLGTIKDPESVLHYI